MKSDKPLRKATSDIFEPQFCGHLTNENILIILKRQRKRLLFFSYLLCCVSFLCHCFKSFPHFRDGELSNDVLKINFPKILF